MSDRFIKLYPSEELSWLIRRHGNSFILLTLIAERARRYNGHPDGLIIGDALIGSTDLEPGLSRQNFRTALDKLVEFGYVEIIANGKKFLKREKSTIKVTIKGMLVNLCKSTIFDINPEDANQQTNQRLTNSQPTANHKQERIRISISNDIDNKEDARRAERPHTKDDLSFDFENWKFVGITENDIVEWKAMYPHINLDVEIIKAKNWLKSNPSKNNKKNWRKYLTGWLSRSNDSIENKKASRAAYSGNTHDRTTKDVDGNPTENQYKGRF